MLNAKRGLSYVEDLQTVQEHLSPFGRGITWAWVGILSSLGVFSERGRFEVFFEVSWIHLS